MKASTQASAKMMSLTCSACSSTARALQVRFQGIHEQLIFFGTPPRALVVAGKIGRAALGMLAEAIQRHENAHRPFGGIEPRGNFVAQFFEFLSVRSHQQVLRVIAEKFAGLVTLGHMVCPEVSVVDCTGHDHLRQASRSRAGQSRIAGGIYTVDDQIGQLVRGDIDNAHEFARRRQTFERFAADARCVKQNDFVAQRFEPLGHAFDTSGRAAE